VAKVLWIADGGCNTGFGRVTHSIGDRLVDEYGHDISVLAINHRGDHWPTKLKLYRPNTLKQDDIFGFSRVVEMLGKVEPDVVVMLNDPYVLLSYLFENNFDRERILLQYRPLITYLPVDGTNQPPTWSSVLTGVSKTVAMSKHGQSVFPKAELVYHGVDSKAFYPISDESPLTLSNGEVVKSKRDCKRAFGYDPDGFLVLRVDKNSGRKDFAATWKALVPVLKKYKDIQVHFHTEGKNSQSGVDLGTLFTREEDVHTRFFLPDMFNTFDGWAEQDLCALYNAADIFVSTSRGEGFGLTIAESLACSVPVIAQNVSAIPEVVGEGGILVEPQRLITVPAGQDIWLSDVNAFSEAIEHLYLAGGTRRKLGAAGREHISKFTWDFAASRFHEYIEAMSSGTGA
jgi:glycosyltransferase involved in cell wall biosynthesis